MREQDFDLGAPDARVQAVTVCEGCHQYRGCAKYRGLWICVDHCWRNRVRIHTNRSILKRREAEHDDEDETGKVVHRHRKRPRAGRDSGAGAHYRRQVRQ